MIYSEENLSVNSGLALGHGSLATAASSNGDSIEDSATINTLGASVLIVTTHEDVVDDGDGLLSLREAIAQAKAGDTIIFADTLAGQTITLVLGQLELSKDITIDGDIDNDGSADITVSGNNASRVFDIVGETATLDGVNVTGGKVENGAGLKIAQNATLIFSNATVSGNNATSSGNNSETGRGAGVFNDGTATFVNVTLSGNSASSGGGVFNDGTATFVNATLSGNTAKNYGGGVYSYFGTVTFVNATLSGNSATGGGGVFAHDNTTSAYNSIVLGNRAGGSSSNSFGQINDSNSFIGGKEGAPAAADVFAAVDANGAGVLADNGGPVHTIALKAGGPAIDAGDATKLVEATIGIDLNGDGDLDDTIVTDATGQDRVFGSGVDLGAFELQEAASTTPRISGVSSTNENGVYKIGDEIAITVTFDEAVIVDAADRIPTLKLETGASDADAFYTGISEDGRTLTFTYIVRKGDSSADLDVTDAAALSLNGATIRSEFGVDADLNLPAPGSDNALGGSKDIVIDGIPPSTLSLSLETDSGLVGDGVTNNGFVAVIGLEPGASWEYSTDAGNTWTPGTEAGFALLDGVYEAGRVQARQIDTSGNVGDANALPHRVAVNTAAPFDIFRLVGDSSDAFQYFDTLRGQPGNPVATLTDRGEAPVVIHGGDARDVADMRAFGGAVTFNGHDGNDTFQFQHGVSGEGSVFNGGAGQDSLQVFARESGSNLKLANTALVGDGETLLSLDSVEVGGFIGGTGDDIFDARESTAQVSVRLGGGTNVFYSSDANNNHVTHSLGNAGAHDTLIGHAGRTTNLVIEGTSGSDELTFAGTSTTYVVQRSDGSEAISAETLLGTITVKGGEGADIADVTEFAGKITFHGGQGADTLVFQHGISGAGTRFNGDDGVDTLIVHAMDAGSNLSVDDAALRSDDGALVELDSVDNVVFHGSAAADTFDASAFTGWVALKGGAGADTLRAGVAGSEITGGMGADRIHLGAGADRVIYDAKGQSTWTELDRIYGFDTNDDELVFTAADRVQGNRTLMELPFLGSSIRFDNGVVEHRASHWSAWKTDLEDLSFGSLGITSLQKAATAVAIFAARSTVLTFEYDEEWYVLEVGANGGVNNLVHLVGTDLNASTNAHDFVAFA